MTGIDDEQLVDKAVAIPVVEAPVDMACFQHLHDVLHQETRVLVGCIAGILLGITFHLDINQVKGEVEIAIALCIEVVVYRTLEGFLRQVLRIKDFIPLRYGSGLVALKGAVVEFRQYRQLTTLSMVEVTTSPLGYTSRGTTT